MHAQCRMPLYGSSAGQTAFRHIYEQIDSSPPRDGPSATPHVHTFAPSHTYRGIIYCLARPVVDSAQTCFENYPTFPPQKPVTLPSSWKSVLVLHMQPFFFFRLRSSDQPNPPSWRLFVTFIYYILPQVTFWVSFVYLFFFLFLCFSY
jgi:hypothetical protein